MTLAGPSGSGKTVLLRAVADLDPHEGTAYLDGQDAQGVSGPEWRRRVGYLPAESHWWADTVGEHLTDPSVELLTALDFEPTALNWSVTRLSSGERQRFALLRLLNHQPQALLLDEPTANLDPANTARVESVLANYRQHHQAAVLWVSHDPQQAARVALRHFEIRRGAIVASDNTS